MQLRQALIRAGLARPQPAEKPARAVTYGDGVRDRIERLAGKFDPESLPKEIRDEYRALFGVEYR